MHQVIGKLKDFSKILDPIRKFSFNYGYEYFQSKDNIKVLDDAFEISPIDPDKGFNFFDHSKTIVNMVKGSKERFSVGIYSDWGTGKTTLMRIIESDLHPILFTWGSDRFEQLEYFLHDHFKSFSLDWIKESRWTMKNENEIAITRRSNSYNIDNEIKNHKRKTRSNKVSIILNKEKSKAILQIDNKPVYFFYVEQKDSQINIRENNVLTIWFDAWRYEREDQFATIALMKTIAFAMGEHPLYQDIKPIILKGITIITKDILKNLAIKYAMVSEKGLNDLEKKFTEKIANLAEIDKDTIYFNGLKKIEEKMGEILKNHAETRVVVFIDDLDRCSPETALEVFESIKVFLDIKGFVFIIGLIQTVMNKIIAKRFDNFDINPEEYLRKIIQIELKIPKWQDFALKNLVHHLLSKLDPNSKQKLVNDEDDKKLIEMIVTEGKDGRKLNPREIKQFINSLVLSLSANQGKVNSKHILVNEVFSTKWKDLYSYLDDPEFKTEFEKYLHTQDIIKKEKVKEAIEKQSDKNIGYEKLTKFEKFLFEVASDRELSSFLQRYNDVIIEIEDKEGRDGWKKYQNLKEMREIRVTFFEEEKLAFFNQLHNYLTKTRATFLEQSEIRDKLYQSLTKKYDPSGYSFFEEFFEKNYDNMDKEERSMHDSIRQLTQVLNVYNYRIFSLLRDNRHYFKEMLELNSLYEHLTGWLQKYKEKFSDVRVSIIYFIEKPFPVDLHQKIEAKINELKYMNISKEKLKKS